MSGFTSLLKRDLLLAVRQGGGIGTALGFFLTVIVMLPLGLGPDQALLQRIAPGRCGSRCCFRCCCRPTGCTSRTMTTARSS